jgi:para-nitrobenzyl esterase
MLATSTLAQGLFHRAVVMSGGEGTRPGTATLSEIEGIGATFGLQNGVRSGDAEAVRQLRGLPVEKVVGGTNLGTMSSQNPRTYVGPFVDGQIVTDTGLAYDSGRFHRVPMMIGATSADIGGRTGFMVGGARRISEKLAAVGVPVFQYRFSYVANSEPASGSGAAPHATDIPFFFNTQDAKYGRQVTARDKTLGETISSYLVNFVKTGDPNGTGLPAWPRYKKDGIIMDFIAEGTAVATPDPWGKEIDQAPPAPYPDMIISVRNSTNR